MKKKYFLALICLILSNLQAASDSKDIAKLKALISERILKIFPNVEKNPNEIIYSHGTRKSRSAKEDVFDTMSYEYDKITPLLIAIDDADVASVKALIQMGANVDFKVFNYIYQTAIRSHQREKQKEYVEIAKVLHDAGADVNMIHKGETPLTIIASGRENPSFVKYLIDIGADISIKNEENKDALDIAEDWLKYKARYYPRYDAEKEVVDILRQEKKYQEEKKLIPKQIYESEILPKDLANIVGKYS